MTIEEAKNELEKFVTLKTTMRPAFLDVILNAEPTTTFVTGMTTEKQVEFSPVRHGHWTRIGTIDCTWLVHRCSSCGYQTIDNGQYCPNCGAKMDEVNDEDN